MTQNVKAVDIMNFVGGRVNAENSDDESSSLYDFGPSEVY